MYGRAYRRVSDADRQGDNESLGTQDADIQRYADDNGIIMLGDYLDMDSGKNVNRTAYQRLLADLRPGECVLVWRIDRLGRDKAESFRVAKDFQQRGVRLISVTQPGTENPQSLDLLILVSAWESETLSARVKPNMRRRAMRGEWCTTAPHWYEIGADGHLCPAPDAPDAQRMWDMFLATADSQATATAFGFKHMNTFRNVLRNPVYIGIATMKDIEVIDAHPAIVRRESWEAARALIAARRTVRVRERGNPHLLTGYLYAGESGERMYAHTTYPDGVPYTYYRSRHIKGSCPGVREWIADEAVLAWLCTLSLDQTAHDRHVTEIRSAEASSAATVARARLTNDLTRLQAEKVVAARMAARGDIDAETFDAMKREHVMEEMRIKNALGALPGEDEATRTLASLHARIGLADDIDRLYHDGALAPLRMLIAAFIQRVVIWHDRNNEPCMEIVPKPWVINMGDRDENDSLWYRIELSNNGNGASLKVAIVQIDGRDR